MEHTLAHLLEENLHQVWSVRDAATRLKSIEKIYVENAGLYHVGHQTNGFEAINNSVTEVLRNMPENFVFSMLKPVIINNDIGRLIWGIGVAGQPPVATGMDIAHFENNKIKSLYVFLD